MQTAPVEQPEQLERLVHRISKAIGSALPLVVLSACGGGGDDGFGGNGGNTPPTANAGADSTVFEGTSVNLAGSGGDADGDPLTFAWTQTAGQTVTINNAGQAAASFTAPDVVAGAPETLTFELRVSDGTDNRSDTVRVTIEENEPPTANAGPDRNVIESTQVTIDGRASSDPNTIDTLTYSWTQIGGTPVTLSADDTSQPTFTAPSVPSAGVEVLEFQLTVSDGVNDDVDTVSITAIDGQPLVSIAGQVSYEFVEAFPLCTQLDFGNIVTRPVRGATVQLIDSTSNNIIASTTASDAGDYLFTDVTALTDVRLRVRGELKRQGGPDWDVEVRDNVDTDSPIPPLKSRPLYVVEFPDFNTGGNDIVNNDFTATTGWDGVSYTGVRAAAPLAILDAIYTGMQLVLGADANANFPPLDVYWSVDNTRVSGATIDADSINNGELSGAFYISSISGVTDSPSLFLTGDVNVDTSEFDDDVVVHEWGHYFEYAFSRSDSIGGPHALGETLDARLAWGEGWATAFAAMALGNIEACNTFAVGSSGGFGINVESANFGQLQGWYNEVSVATLLYDLFDANNDGPDDNSIGFQPIFDTMVGPQASTAAFTTIFSFAAELRTMLNAEHQSFLDAQLTRENINPIGIDIWASNELTNDAGNVDALPLYTDMVADGSITPICTNSDFDRPQRTGNKLAEDRYIRLSVPATDTYNVVVSTSTPTPGTPSDPNIYIYRDGQQIDFGISGNAGLESFTTSEILQAGEIYSVYVEEFRFEDPGTPTGFPERICFDVSFTATP